jgi:hypothetical protein
VPRKDAAAVLVTPVEVGPVEAEAPRSVVRIHFKLLVVMVTQVGVDKELPRGCERRRKKVRKKDQTRVRGVSKNCCDSPHFG